MKARLKNGLNGVLNYLVIILIAIGLFQLLGMPLVTPEKAQADLVFVGGFALLRFAVDFYRTPKVENETDSQS